MLTRVLNNAAFTSAMQKLDRKASVLSPHVYAAAQVAKVRYDARSLAHAASCLKGALKI
jgi:hypothetical protein